MTTHFTYYVYILASGRGGTLYVGITNNMTRRLYEHQNYADKNCFTCRYKVTQLMYLETFDNVMDAILREKKLKKWRRSWKLRLITQTNPQWEDLSAQVRMSL